MATFAIAAALATEKHDKQLDKGGNPYILHPLRVANSLVTENEKIVGVLHDIIEDTNCTYDELKELGFSQEIITALECLTKRPGETRKQAARRAGKNRLACAVKLADIRDNMDLSRIPNPTQHDHDRIEQYKDAQAILLWETCNRWDRFSDRHTT